MKLDDCRIVHVDSAKRAGRRPFVVGDALQFAATATYSDDKPHTLAINDEARDRWIGVEKDTRDIAPLVQLDTRDPLKVGEHKLRIVIDSKPTDIVLTVQVEPATK